MHIQLKVYVQNTILLIVEREILQPVVLKIVIILVYPAVGVKPIMKDGVDMVTLTGFVRYVNQGAPWKAATSCEPVMTIVACTIGVLKFGVILWLWIQNALKEAAI